MHLAELKTKSPSDLLSYAESLQIENASSLRKQDMMFAILKTLPRTTRPFMAKVRWKSCPTVLGFCAARKPTICLVRMISMSVRAKCAALVAHRGIRSKARFAPRRTASVTSRC